MKNIILFLSLIMPIMMLSTISYAQEANDTAIYVSNNDVLITYNQLAEPFSLSVFYRNNNGVMEDMFTTCRGSYVLEKLIDDGYNLSEDDEQYLYMFYEYNHDTYLKSNINKDSYYAITKLIGSCKD